MTTDTSAPTPISASCYRHNGRESYIRCTRCDRFICPDCMRSAAVGHQCPDCVREGGKSVRQARGRFGGSVVTGHSAPNATIALIILNFAVYALEVMRNRSILDLETLGSGVTWDGSTLHQAGIAHGEYYRLVTGFFTHSLPSAAPFGIAHILLNMVALWCIGPELERLLGRARFLALYLLAGLGSSVLVYLLTPYTGAVGASGAIFGLVGAYFVFGRKLGIPGNNRMLLYYVVWLVASWSYTSWQGHLGGLITGLLIGAILAYAPRRRREPLQWLGLTALLALIIGAALVETAHLHSKQTLDIPSATAAASRTQTTISHLSAISGSPENLGPWA